MLVVSKVNKQLNMPKQASILCVKDKAEYKVIVYM